MSVVFTRLKTPGFTGFCGKAQPGGPSGGPQCVALQVQRLGAVRLRDAGVADQHVSQTAVCDTRAKTPSSTRRRVSYPVSDSMSCRRRTRRPVPRAERALRIARTDGVGGPHHCPRRASTRRTNADSRGCPRRRNAPPPPGHAPGALWRASYSAGSMAASRTTSSARRVPRTVTSSFQSGFTMSLIRPAGTWTQ